MVDTANGARWSVEKGGSRAALHLAAFASIRISPAFPVAEHQLGKTAFRSYGNKTKGYFRTYCVCAAL